MAPIGLNVSKFTFHVSPTPEYIRSFVLERVKTTSTVYECTKHLIYEKVITE